MKTYSIVAITNQSGQVVEKRLFDAWGLIVKVQDIVGNVLTGLVALDRGYTSHEHLLGVNIINMNGRVYDHHLHKFLQPDNNIQDFYNTQNYNRYGYVMNNPTKYTDESGEFWGYIIGALFNAYAAGYNSSGDYNPLNWNSTAWTNAGLGAASFAASAGATYYADNYITNYGNNNVVVDDEHDTYTTSESPWNTLTQGFINGDESEIFGEEKRNDYGSSNGSAYAYYLKGSKGFKSYFVDSSYNYSFLEANAGAVGDFDGFTLSADASYFKQDGSLSLGLKNFNGHAGGNFEFLSASTQLSGYLHGGKQGIYGFNAVAEAGAQVLKAEINGGFTFFGAKINYSAEVTGLSAHAGHSSALFYDSNTGVLSFKDAAHLGWIVGGGGGIDISVPLKDWGNILLYYIRSK